MKKIILIFILYSLNCRSQSTASIWQKIPDDVKHHYAGVSINVITTLSLYKLTHNRWIAQPAGFLFANVVNIFKEYVWDGYLHRGVKSMVDLFNTFWGSICGTIYVGIPLHIKEDKMRELADRFLNLCEIDINRALPDTTVRIAKPVLD